MSTRRLEVTQVSRYVLCFVLPGQNHDVPKEFSSQAKPYHMHYHLYRTGSILLSLRSVDDTAV